MARGPDTGSGDGRRRVDGLVAILVIAAAAIAFSAGLLVGRHTAPTPPGLLAPAGAAP